MKTCHIVALSVLVGAALGTLTNQGIHAQDAYIRNVPLDPLPVPVIPRGSTLDLRPARPQDADDQMSGYTSDTKDRTTPSIGLSIKAPLDDRK